MDWLVDDELTRQREEVSNDTGEVKTARRQQATRGEDFRVCLANLA